MMNRYYLWRLCVKCNSIGARSTYVLAIDVIRRRCTNCGYIWDELPLDSERS